MGNIEIDLWHDLSYQSNIDILPQLWTGQGKVQSPEYKIWGFEVDGGGDDGGGGGCGGGGGGNGGGGGDGGDNDDGNDDLIVTQRLRLSSLLVK